MVTETVRIAPLNIRFMSWLPHTVLKSKLAGFIGELEGTLLDVSTDHVQLLVTKAGDGFWGSTEKLRFRVDLHFNWDAPLQRGLTCVEAKIQPASGSPNRDAVRPLARLVARDLRCWFIAHELETEGA